MLYIAQEAMEVIMELKIIGVIGAGTMGTGIAQAAAAAGYSVVLGDIKIEKAEASMVKMKNCLDSLIEEGKLTAEKRQEILDKVAVTDNIKDYNDADMIIEAVLENLELKAGILSQLNDICRKETIFATNTCSISITEIAKESGRADRFCGIHFFNPVNSMKLVEVIKGMDTAQETIEAALQFALSLGKTPVEVKRDSPGFIVSRLLYTYLNEAAKMLSEGVASVEDIDTAVKLGLNYPMGPFEMLDYGGMDRIVDMLNYFWDELNNSNYAPQPILKDMIRAGKLGTKTGEGFYRY